MIDNLQYLIKQYRQDWHERGYWQDPTLADSVDFAVTEIGELYRAYMGGAQAEEAAAEAFDVLMMTIISAEVGGLSLRPLTVTANAGAIVERMTDGIYPMIEARLRLETRYTRNNPMMADKDRLCYCLSDMAGLALSFVRAKGLDMDEVGRGKLERMEAKRR